MDTPSATRNPAQAVAAGHDDLSGTARARRLGEGGGTGGGKQPTLVAQQPHGTQPGADDCLL